MPFPFLQEEEVKQIHEATLRVLSDVGVVLDDDEGRTLLLDHGAALEKDRVRLPAELVESCLKRCPARVLIRGRNGQAILGDGALHVHNLGGARDVLDCPGGTLRPATSQDVATSARLLDALENVTSVTPLYTPRDVPSEMMALTMFEQTARNTLKPLSGPGVTSVRDVRLLHEMIQVILGDPPAVTLSASPVSPLNFCGEVVPVILEIARSRIPLGPLPCPNVGATAPMSLAGALVLQNAEVLACIALAQLISPGLPIVYCGRLSVLNMRSGAPIWGNPEVGILSAATVQLGHIYGLPVNVYGLAGSGFSPDMQSGYERAINALAPALAGADELSGVGEMAGGIYSANFQMVIDDEIFGMVRRVRRGFEVNPDSLAVDVIAHAMQGGRNFLAEQHSRKYLRQGEIWQSRLGVPESSWEQWYYSGAKTILERAQAEAERLLVTHQVPPLPDEQSRELDAILNSAQRRIDDAA